jgi:hypothetical protein
MLNNDIFSRLLYRVSPTYLLCDHAQKKEHMSEGRPTIEPLLLS